jgi:hypothetical protein
MHPAVQSLSGDVTTLPFYAGMVVGSITRKETAAEVVADLAAAMQGKVS